MTRRSADSPHLICPEVLSSITPSLLAEFCWHHHAAFLQAGLNVPGNFDELWLTPSTVPPAVLEALHFVDELATSRGMQRLLEFCPSLRASGAQIPADVAVRAWILDPHLLQRVHAEARIERIRSFEHYQASQPAVWNAPTPEIIQALERDLDSHFESQLCGRGTRVFPAMIADRMQFVIRRGKALRRRGCLEGERSSTIVYRPEQFDVVTYVPSIHELQVHATSMADRTMYREAFGHHLFDCSWMFPDGTNKYTLKPLCRDGVAALCCQDVPEIQHVWLRELHVYRGGQHVETTIIKADDVLGALQERQERLLWHGQMVAARFEIRFRGALATRSVAIRPSNIAEYSRNEDAEVVEAWLQKRGFLVREGERHAKTGALLACA